MEVISIYQDFIQNISLQIKWTMENLEQHADVH